MSELEEPLNFFTDELFQKKKDDPLKRTGSSWNFSPKGSYPKPNRKLSIKEVDFSERSQHLKSEDEKSAEIDTDVDEDEVDEKDEASQYEEEYSHQANEEDGEEESGLSLESASAIYSKLSPFSIKWAFGVATTVKMINLTTETASEIFYVASHFGVIFDYCLNKMEFLPGHNYPIQSISADASGRWLVSADCGEDTVIIVWDNTKRLPAWSLYNVFPGGVKLVRISQDARFLIAVNCVPSYSLKFWQWTLGNEEPDGTIDLDRSYGIAKHVAFNHLRTEIFAVTLTHKVVFCEYDGCKEISTFPAPFEFTKKKIGTFKESIFLDDNHTALTTTNTGYVIVWCDVEFSQPVLEGTRGTIEKNFVKIVRIHKSCITNIRLCDNTLITACEDGTIYFHDQYLRLMYLIPKLKLDPIMSISFNISDSTHDPFEAKSPETPKEEEAEDSMADGNDDDHKTRIKFVEEANFLPPEKQSETNVPPVQEIGPGVKGFENKVKQIPSDCTVEMRPFVIRDFVFLTKTGKMGYLSHQRKRIKYFLYKADGPVLAIGCNPHKSHLVVSYLTGWLVLYNYVTKKSMVAVNIPSTKITCLTYSHLGHILLAGTENGNILMLNPLILTINQTLHAGKFPIEKIRFSHNDTYIAGYDQSSCVHVYNFQQLYSKRKWMPLGKYISHYKPINDILFEDRPEGTKKPRLFTLGQDRMLVEYDTANFEPNKLKILDTHRIEQTAIPLCFIWHPNFYKDNDILVSNSEYKLKVVDSKNLICQKTTLGPTADTPIRQMEIVPEPSKPAGSKTAKMIYASQRQIGVMILPSTGNPFEGIGMFAHPVEIIAMVHSHDYKYIFTAGKKDFTVLMWEMNLSAVEIASQIGGGGLEPFISLIEGGADSFFFQEIEDFFYYSQIIHQGEDANADRSVSKNMSLCEIPDLFRSLGYYPTDYEIQNLIYELKHLKYHETGEIVKEISFEECVKAFLNHKPVHGITLSHINNALLAIADLSDPADILVERTELYKALEDRAEAMDHREVQGYLCILLLPSDENNPVPATLSLNDFATNVLGIDLTISEEQVKQITHPFENKKKDVDGVDK